MLGSETNATIVVGVDSSYASMAAVEWASEIASASDATLHLVHGFSPDQAGFAFGMDTDGAQIRSAGESMLQRTRRHIESVDPKVRVTTHQSDDYPAKTLVRASRNAAVVVLGVKGDSHLSFSAVGQTATQVASHAVSPVAVIRKNPGSEQAYGRITVGLDPSPDARTALAWACQHAQHTGAEVQAVHAWQPRSAEDPHLRRADWEAYADRTRERLEEWIEPHRAQHPGVKVRSQVVQGNPTKVLVKESHASDLMVLGARGAGGFDGLRLGAVARDLLGHADCSVVLTR